MLDKPLHAQLDRLRDIVEKFLTMYLSDPLVQTLTIDKPSIHAATPGSKSRFGVPGSHASPFDLPSAARPGMLRSKTDSHIFTGSPVSRRTFGDGETILA